MMKDARETADLAGFLICLCLGFTFAFKVLIPTLHDVQMEMMKYLFGVGFGFGIGVCFYLIWVPIHHFICRGFDMLGTLLEWVVKKVNKPDKKILTQGGGNEEEGGHDE
jgi:hypothetical protein